MNDALPAGAGIGRVALRVSDLDETAAFYEDVIGLERLDSAAVEETAPPPDGERAVLGVADEALLVLDGAPDAPARGPTEAGLYHVAVMLPDRAALGTAIERIRRNSGLDGAADHGVSEAIYCRDPAGNGLECYVDRPKSEWPMEGDRVVMETDPLDLEDLVSLSQDARGGEAASAELPAGTTIGHVHLEATDLESTRSLYADALGMRLRQRFGDEAIFLAAGDYHHHVGANTWRHRSAPAGDGLGLAWFEVLVPEASALDAAVERLGDGGFEVDRSAEGAVAVADPDGIGLRLRIDEGIAVPTGE